MDARRKKLLFRSQHCGMKENDIYNWVTGKEAPPARHDTAFLARLIAFNDCS
jgi:succinate dehydrogenase flavin-adding protein (antitoxin of CptAB toxin-antitoxin module)